MTVTNLDRLIGLAERYPAISEKYINQAIATSLVMILGYEKSSANTPVDTGNLKNNWSTKFGRFEGSLFSNAPYGMAVNNGSRPHMPPMNAITTWALKRGLNPWAVAKSIAKNGTRPNPFWDRTLVANTDPVNRQMNLAISNIMKEL